MNWHEYFFEICKVIKLKSKDTSTKVGCVIVAQDNSIRATGFNGFPRGVNDRIEGFLGVPERFERPAKYMFTEHAERNAIYSAVKSGVSLNNCKIYVDWIPCCDCARAIIQAGLVEVIIDGTDYEIKEKYWNERWKDSMDTSKAMFEEAGVKLTFINKEK